MKDSKFKVKISKILIEIIVYSLSEGVHQYKIVELIKNVVDLNNEFTSAKVNRYVI